MADGILFINLDRSTSRAAAIEAAFAGTSPPLSRIAGIEGSRIPQVATGRLATPALKATKWPGTLGCMLGHLAALEAVLSRGFEKSLILEDDARPTEHFPADLSLVELPEQFDLCFVNRRMNGLPDAEAPDPRIITVAEALSLLPPNTRAPGGDGYVVSAAGARKLLTWFAEDGLGHFFDWRLLAYGLDPDSLSGLDPACTLRAVIGPLQRANPRNERLTAFVLRPSLIATAKGPSDILEETMIAEAAKPGTVQNAL